MVWFAVVYMYKMKTTFDFNFCFLPRFQISMDTQYINIQHGNKEKLSIYNFSLFTCKHVIWKKLVSNQNFNRKVVFIVSKNCIMYTLHGYPYRIRPSYCAKSKHFFPSIQGSSQLCTFFLCKIKKFTISWQKVVGNYFNIMKTTFLFEFKLLTCFFRKTSLQVIKVKLF